MLFLRSVNILIKLGPPASPRPLLRSEGAREPTGTITKAIALDGASCISVLAALQVSRVLDRSEISGGADRAGDRVGLPLALPCGLLSVDHALFHLGRYRSPPQRS